MSCNPWLVENIQEFSFLNCPECVFKVKEEDLFQDHAVRNHSQSSALFGHNAKSEFITVKTEPSSEISSEDFKCLLSSNVDDITIEEHNIDPLGSISPKKEKNLEDFNFPEPKPDEEIPAKRRKINSNSEPNKDAGYEKPCMTHAQLIAEALNNAPEKTLVLSDIYKAINTKYPYYKLETQGWQNNIKHTLSVNENFIRGEKANSGVVDDIGNHFDTHEWYWELSKDVHKSLLESKNIHRKPRYLLNSNKLEKNSGEFDFAAKLQIETLTSNMLKRKSPSDKSSKKAKICPPYYYNNDSKDRHNFKKTNYKCGRCNFETENKEKKSYHKKICPGKIKHFKCSDCGEDYTQKEDLIEHMKTVHNKERFYRNFKCLYCEYSGQYEKMIIEHIELCHSVESTQNDKDIDQNVDKDVEKKIEKGVKENGEIDTFKGEKIVDKHIEIETIKLRTSNSKALNVTCTICDLPFMNKEIMENHVVTVHKSINIICPICDLAFINKELMENHIVAVHERKAPYQVISKKTTQFISAKPSLRITPKILKIIPMEKFPQKDKTTSIFKCQIPPKKIPKPIIADEHHSNQEKMS